MFVPESKSWKELFVYESNFIDPQPGYNGGSPGCPMFENHMNALNFVLSDGSHYTKQATDEIEYMLSDKCKSARYVRVHFNNKFKLVEGIAYLDK